MFKVLIVDDERLDRDGLKNQVDWSKLFISAVETAKNGFEALELIKAMRPDILLTDVKMPGMSGLSLAQKTRELLPWVKVIFVSGFDDFEYVKNALLLNAYQYILKPVDTSELLEALTKAVNERIREKKSEEEKLLLMRRVDESKPLLKQKVVKEMLFGTADREKVLRDLRYLKLKIHDGCLRVLLCEPDDYEIMAEKLEDGALRLLETKISGALGDIAPERCRVEHAQIERSRFAVILSFDADIAADEINSVAEGIAGEIIDRVKCGAGISLSIGVGGTAFNIEGLRSSYDDSRRALRMKLLAGKGRVLNENKGKNRKIIAAVKKYIEDNYSGDLTLKDIAQELFYSPNYLGAIFKEELGAGFSEYLAEYRMKKAAELLRQPYLKTYEIANRVGYRNISAFINQFKLSFKMTPTEFRERC